MRGVCMDATVRKEAQADRDRLQERERVASLEKAALQERQRLARELHDSVSQALYGIGLGAQTALDALGKDRDWEAAAEAMRYVHDLSGAGIAEMRALIFELRPESLEQDGLVEALDRHAASVHARHALQVDTRLGVEPDIPLETKEALYRIAQEALYNAVRHARASTVSLCLELTAEAVTLAIGDNGVGFEPRSAYPGHLGLTSMRERAAAVGAELTIRTAAGQGTRVQAVVPIRG